MPPAGRFCKGLTRAPPHQTLGACPRAGFRHTAPVEKALGTPRRRFERPFHLRQLRVDLEQSESSGQGRGAHQTGALTLEGSEHL